MDMLSLLQKQQLVERINQVKESKGLTWEQIAKTLYQILDDIDTEDDHCKSNNEAFRRFVMQHQAKKNQYLFSPDGYALERVNEELEANKQEEIPLTNTQLKAMVDPEDYDRVAKLSWFLKTDKRTNVHYVAHSERVGNQVKTIRLHRFITNAGPDVDVHHKDLNPLNCHKDNLEIISKDLHRSYHTKRYRHQKPDLTSTVESIQECVCHIYEMDNDELLRFYRSMPNTYKNTEGRILDTYEYDREEVRKEILKRGLLIPVPLIESMTDWARNELQMAGLFDKDSDYDGMLGEAVMDLIDKFSEQGHSGFSAELTSNIFDRLIHWKPLSELTNNPNEWIDVSEKAGQKLYQSKRSPSCFSRDGGLTYYDLDEEICETQEDGGINRRPSYVIHAAKKKEWHHEEAHQNTAYDVDTCRLRKYCYS